VSSVPSTARRWSRGEWAAIIAAALFGIALIWIFRLRGWYPHDEGTLGQSAERILMGQVPHRDFDDPYTGGLALLHALVFRIGGISVNGLRNHLALVATIWFGGVFWLLLRWCRPFGAALVAVLIVVFSVPLYPAAMPSWYVLFLSCAAAGVLVMQRERRNTAAFWAGMLVGLAALAKITAVFALAGAGWALVMMRQAEDRERRGAAEIIAAALAFALLVVMLVRSHMSDRTIAHLALPPIAVVLGIAGREWRQGRLRGFGIDATLWRRIASLAIGAAIPVIFYAAWLASHDALGPFIASLRAVVGQRSASAFLPAPSLRSVMYALPIAAILFVGGRRFGVRPLVLALGGLALGVLAWSNAYVHANFWYALRGLLPVGALAAAMWWGSARPEIGENTARRALVVLVPITAMLVLTQFPFSATVYFIYVAPLLLMGLSAAVALQEKTTQRNAMVLGAIYLLFGVLQVIPDNPDSLGMSVDHSPGRASLDIPRARIHIVAEDAELYRGLAAIMDSLPPGPIWAGPDAPDVAFLTGRRDLNRSYFAFLGDEDPPRPDVAARMVARGAVAMVIDTEPSFSKVMTEQATDSVRRYFPDVQKIGRFHIYSRGRQQ
jgi:hypothetical protein